MSVPLELARTHSERAILKVVRFWYPKAKTTRNGHVWLIKTAEEFQRHGVDYKRGTIWKALRELNARGVLVVEKHEHPFRPLSYASWIRPGPKAEECTFDPVW